MAGTTVNADNCGTAGPDNHHTEVEVWGTCGKPTEERVPSRIELPKPMFR